MVNRRRKVKKQIWLDYSEDDELKKKCKKANMNEAQYIRSLILGYKPTESPPEEFYKVLEKMTSISSSLNRIVEIANMTDKINVNYYESEAQKWNDLIIEIKQKYLLSKK